MSKRDPGAVTLLLNPGQCREAGCRERASIFGYCKDHLSEPLDAAFDKVVRDGIAQPLPPKCFESEAQWKEYAVAFDLSQLQVSSPVRRAGVDHCRDCSPQYRDEMHSAGRCEHPETVFILSERGRDMQGIPLGRRPEVWEKAMMGMSGQVISLPDADSMNRAVEMLNQMNPIGRKPGRPKAVKEEDDE